MNFSTMNQKTSNRRAAQLIKHINNHAHKQELLQLMSEQLMDDLSFYQSTGV